MKTKLAAGRRLGESSFSVSSSTYAAGVGMEEDAAEYTVAYEGADGNSDASESSSGSAAPLENDFLSGSCKTSAAMGPLTFLLALATLVAAIGPNYVNV